MNFNVYLNKKIGEKINKMAELLHRSRNSIINEALEEWLNRHSASWPKNFFDYDPVEDTPGFKSLRSYLTKEILEDFSP